MTDRSEAPTAKLPPLPKRPAKPRIRKPGPLGVIAGSFGLFFAITALLAFQMRRGADPALGAPKPQVVASATVAPRQIVVRRVIVTRIVEHRPRRGSAPTGSARPASPAPAPRPLQRRLRPAAPAPAPAPRRTRSGAADPPAPHHPLLMTDLTFDCMGTTVRLLTDEADECRAFLEHFDATLSRFRPDSELCRLNADPREEVPVSGLLHAAISAGLLAAELTNGLVDPTLVAQLEAIGYDRTRRDPELAARGRAAADPAPRAGQARSAGAVAPRRAHRRGGPPPARPAPRHRRDGQGPGRRPAREPARGPLGGRLRRRPARRRRPCRRGPPPAHPAVDPHAARRGRGGGHVRHRHAPLARRGRHDRATISSTRRPASPPGRA